MPWLTGRLPPGAPAYDEVVKTFGTFYLQPDGQIDRTRLGRLMFNDPEALARQEAIIHPLVNQALDLLIRRASQKVIVIEAIKLIEARISNECDSLWVVYAPSDLQLKRLVEGRKMSEADARSRVASQLPQEIHMSAANVVIRNEHSFEDTWKQVTAAWARTVPSGEVNLHLNHNLSACRSVRSPSAVPVQSRWKRSVQVLNHIRKVNRN